MISYAVPIVVLALLVHMIGTFVQRWLFFAEAEHVVGLYYGKRWFMHKKFFELGSVVKGFAPDLIGCAREHLSEFK